MLNVIETMASMPMVKPITGPTPLATPMSGSTKGKKMYISTHRPALIRIDFWNAERASSAVAVRPSGGATVGA